MLKIYTYQGCSTCRNAIKWLKAGAIPFEEIAIRETPPSPAELQTVLEARGNELRSLFNVSGQDYRALGLKDKIATLSVDAALLLLADNGNLIKRPFATDPEAKIHLVGFKEEEWRKAFL
jgi:arsenate reductase